MIIQPNFLAYFHEYILKKKGSAYNMISPFILPFIGKIHTVVKLYLVLLKLEYGVEKLMHFLYSERNAFFAVREHVLMLNFLEYALLFRTKTYFF